MSFFLHIHIIHFPYCTAYVHQYIFIFLYFYILIAFFSSVSEVEVVLCAEYAHFVGELQRTAN